MTVKDLDAISSSGTFKPLKLLETSLPYVLIWFLYIYHHRLVRHLIH